jgi:hypothetical protein
MLTTATTGTEGDVKKLVVAVVMCLTAASTDATFGQSGRVGWDGTWVGGLGERDRRSANLRGNPHGFYFRYHYEEIMRSTVAANGDRTFAWDKGEASLTRTPNGGTRLVVHERGKPEVSIPLKREGK